MKLSVLLPLCLFLFAASAFAWYPFSPYHSFTHHHARRLPLHSRLWGFSDPFEDVFRDLEPMLNSVNEAVQQHEQLLHRMLKEAGMDRDGGAKAQLSQASEGAGAADFESSTSAAAETAASEQAEASDTKVQTTRRDASSSKSVSTADNDEGSLLSWFPTELFHGPSLDISSKDKRYEISLDVPGVKKEDIKLEIETDRHGRQILTVSGERKFDSASASKGSDDPSAPASAASGSPRSSSRYGKFVRSLTLPDNVSVDGIEASHQDGVLRISVPKVELEPPKKTQIPIRSALKEEL